MSATVKVALRNRPKKDGTYPLIVRVTKDRKSSIISLGQSVEKKYWDGANRRVRKSHPNSMRMNAFLVKKLSEINDVYLTKDMKEEGSITAKEIHKTYRQKQGGYGFFEEADEYLRLLKKEGKYNRYVSDKPRVEGLKTFLKGKKVSFEELDIGTLKAFKASLKGDKKLTERSAINYLIVIRTIYNLAIKKGLVEQRYYPFGHGKVQIKFPEVIKVGLSKEEITILIQQELSEYPNFQHARNLWLTSFYLAGMRASDVFRLKWSDIKDKRLHYTMGKNNKAGSLLLPDQVSTIFEEYIDQRRSDDDVIFPELKMVDDFGNKFLVQRKISYGVKKANKYLKKLAVMAEINKSMTMHIARHSFAGISGDKIPIQLLQKLYRHTSVLTTMEYQKSFTTDDVDQALDAVLDF